MKKLIALGFAASLMSFGAVANAGPSFDYVQANYTNFDVSGGSLDAFGLGANVSITDRVFFESGITRASESGVNLTNLSGGFGYAHYVSRYTALVGSAGLAHSKVSGAGIFNDSDTGQYASLGLRSQVTENVELGAKALRYWSDANSTEYHASARYYLKDNLSLEFAYLYGDSDSKAYQFGVSYHF